MTQPEVLYRLQEIELNLIQRQKRVSEITAALTNNQAVISAQAEVAAAENVLNPLQRKTRQLEAEIQANNIKVQQTDEQLYSGRVRNPKELQDLQNEIKSLKKRNSELEDTLLENMMVVEEAESVLAEKQSLLKNTLADGESAHTQLLAEQEKLKAEYAVFQQRRQQVLPEVEPENLKIYNALRPKKNNQPVALLVDESCTACRVEQEMAIVQEVRRGQKLTFCTNCGRILLYRSS